jgi:hypothetical protein
MSVDIASIVGAVTGTLSLAGVVYMAGYWKGQVDTDRKAWQEAISLYPPAETHKMVQTLWDIYVMDALRNRPDLANHGSGYSIKESGESLIPSVIKKALQEFPVCTDHKMPTESHGWLVVKCLGVSTIIELSQTLGLTVQETTGLLSLYMKEVHGEKEK